jgi:hypothetical protein
LPRVGTYGFRECQKKKNSTKCIQIVNTMVLRFLPDRVGISVIGIHSWDMIAKARSLSAIIQAFLTMNSYLCKVGSTRCMD